MTAGPARESGACGVSRNFLNRLCGRFGLTALVEVTGNIRGLHGAVDVVERDVIVAVKGDVDFAFRDVRRAVLDIDALHLFEFAEKGFRVLSS